MEKIKLLVIDDNKELIELLKEYYSEQSGVDIILTFERAASYFWGVETKSLKIGSRS